MRVKLDENLGRRGADEMRAAGHDVSTVLEQGLSSAPDVKVIDACRQEQRCLVTLDLDFGNPLQFRPCEFSGIAVLRIPPHASHQVLVAAVQTLIAQLVQASIDKRLWIVEIGRVRMYQDEEFETDQLTRTDNS